VTHDIEIGTPPIVPTRIRALIFDFDGLILDTEGPEFQAWSEVFTAHGHVLDLVEWSRNIGTVDTFDPHLHLEILLGRALEREEIRARRRQRSRELIAAQTVLPGVAEYLADAKRLGLKVSVASSSPRSWVAGHLERLGLIAHFDCLRCGDEVEVVKPDPALYQTALDLLGVSPEEAIAFEDSPNGILAAKRAGLFCVAVPNGVTGQLDVSHADLRLGSLAELSLEQLLARCSSIE
jgi:HAD superfamily hydrolase (TIGR01509 family)